MDTNSHKSNTRWSRVLRWTTQVAVKVAQAVLAHAIITWLGL
ncbi:hypothetical protein ACFTY8_46590 [Streptomyces mirabilis]